MKCELCGADIIPEEIHYKLCVHMEVQDAVSNKLRILDIQALETRCKACVEKEVVTW